MSSSQNVTLETPTVARTAMKEVFSSLTGVYMSVDRFYQRDSVTTVQDAVLNLYRCVVEINTKARFEDVV